MRPSRPDTDQPFQRYVVVDMISSVDMEPDVLETISETLKNKQHFIQTKNNLGGEFERHLIAPRGSIIGKLVSKGKGRGPDIPNFVIMYPFFSSHLCLPVKPGETVWGMKENDEKVFWLSRVHEPDHVEDPNYTHSDRNKMPTVQGILEIPDTQKIEVSKVPGFPNGNTFANRETDLVEEPYTKEKIKEAGIQEDEFQLGEINRYERIIQESIQKSKIVYEPVPRYTKRPGDLVMQGSNNSTIVLGTERGYGSGASINPEKSSSEPENDTASSTGLNEGMGAIDIVVGRGRLHQGAEAEENNDPTNTRPRVVKNTRDNFETDKAVGLDDTKAPKGSAVADSPEGDPDFVNDAARIYMSMKSNPDVLFGLNYPDQPEGGTSVAPTPDNSSIVFKSDQIRIVARKDEENGINGSIRIIKEGEGDSDRATIVLQPDGSIMIDGPKIVIGSGIESENGSGNQVFIGRDASESVVLGNVLTDSVLLPFFQAMRDNAPTISVGASPNALSPAVITAITNVLDALGDPAGPNTILSKNAKTK